MSQAPALVDQARRLVDCTRSLPVDEAAGVLERFATMAQAAQAEVLAEAQRSGKLRDCGVRSVRGFAASILRRSVGDASMVAQVALRLVDFPQLAEVYRDGRAHTANLRAIVEAVGCCGLEVLQAHEPALVDLAVRAGPGEIKQFCQLLADLNHPDRDEKKVRAQSGKMVRIARVGDLMHLDAMLDPALGARLKATLTAMARHAAAEHRREKRQDRLAAGTDNPAAGGTTPGEGTGPDRPVPFTQRCADALAALLRTGMDAADLPTLARRRPHAVIHADLATLLGLPGHGRAFLERFGLLPPGTAATLCCDALVRVVLTHGHRVLNAGHTTRLVTAAQHTALAATHQTCAMPGCGVPFTDCDIHHLWWWSLQGPTDLHLQVPLCATHHRHLHDGDYSLTREHGHLVFRDPHGRLIADPQTALTTQLDLLTQHHGPAPETDQTAHEVIRQATTTQDWPDSRYQHGAWGWNGHNPAPPPGHAPPRPA
ncbi:MAG: HNH endonuclease [Actinomycetota bacterium]|nr:HNH endonuclease [Actinomycetota bacterium]